MRAISLFAARNMQLVERPRPAMHGNNRVRLKIASVGLCGSDLHYYKDGHIGPAQSINDPFTPGHEFSAHLVDDVPERGLNAGDLVAVDPCIACGECEWCDRGEINLCPTPDFLGAPPRDGALLEEMVVRPERLVAMPPGINTVQAALLEPLGVCIHALDLAKPEWWETVAVVGCGPIGLGIIQLLKDAGVDRILAVEPTSYRRQKASDLGAEHVFASVGEVIDHTNGRGADLVIEATNDPDGFDCACRAARIGGRAVIVGIPDGNRYSFEAATARRKQLSVIFSRRMAEVYPRAIRLVTERGLDIERLVSHRIGLAQVPQAFEWLSNHERDAIKIVVDPQN